MNSSLEILNVYVPAEESELRDEIWPGSAIVGSEVGDTGRLRIDYEGDEATYPSFRDRLRRAAERHTWEGLDGKHGYPTKACAYVEPNEVREVGQYAPDDGELRVAWPEPLIQWVGRQIEVE